MAIEIEIKLAGEVDDLQDRLQRAGAHRLEPRVLEDDLVFDDEDGSLERAGELLRLRRRGDERATLTFKRPAAVDARQGGGDLKVRHEWEVGVDEPEEARLVLEGLGFTPVVRYQKYRTRYRLDGVDACLDETPVGTYLELEGSAEAIRRLAGRLGFGPEDFEVRAYLEIHRDLGGRGDMVFG